jgi:predicted dehydrogenase
MTKKLRVGIISANWGALAHLPAWRALEDVEVIAMCTSRQETAEKAAQQYQIERPYWSVEAMCADPDIDIIDVGTSPIQRERMVMTALDAGKHVVNEMPFAASLDGAKRLVARQHETGLKGGAAPSVVGMPHVGLMKEMIEEGYCGEIFQIQCSWHLGFFLKIFPGFTYTWFGQQGHGASLTRNQGSHMLHLLRHLFGPVRSVVGRMETQLKNWELPDGGGTMAVETDDTLHSLIAFESGAMCTLATSWNAADNPGFVLDVLGSKGRLRLETLRYPSAESAKLYAAKAQLAVDPAGSLIEVPERFFTAGGQLVAAHEFDAFNSGQRVSLARLFDSFAGSVLGGPPPLVTFDRAVEIQGIIEALYESHAKRTWVDIIENAVV